MRTLNNALFVIALCLVAAGTALGHWPIIAIALALMILSIAAAAVGMKRDGRLAREIDRAREEG